MAAAGKVRTGAVRGLTRGADIKAAVAAVKHVPPHVRPAVRRHIMRKAKGIKGAARHIPPHWHPSGAIRHVRPAQALALAEAAGVTLDLANDLSLAGKWKHGWIPLDAVAAAVKAKRYHGGGGEGRTVRGKGRAGSAVESRREPSRGRTKAAIPAGRRADAGPRREAHVSAHQLSDGRTKLSDSRSGESVKAVHLASFHSQGHTITGVRGGLMHTRDDSGKAHVYDPATGRAAESKGSLPTRGRTFSDAGEAFSTRREHGLPTGARKAAKVTPVGSRLEHSEPQYVVPADHATAARAAIRMRAPELRDRAGKGDKIAQAELDRRAGKRAEKVKASAGKLQQVAQDRTRRVQNAQVAKDEAKVRAVQASHPVGSWVHARQPGIERGTYGKVVGHDGEGMLQVEHKDFRGKTAVGRFNPSHVKKAHGKLPPGYAVVEDRVQPAPGYSQGTGRYSFTDSQGRKHYVGGSPQVAANRASSHSERVAQEKRDAFTRRSALAVAERRKQAEREKHRAIKIEHAPPATIEETRLMQQAAALHYSADSRANVSTTDVQRIAESDSPYITAESRAKAQELLPERGYQMAKQRLVGQSDEQLRQIQPRLAGSALSAHEKAGAERYIAERLGSRPKADAPPADGGAGGGDVSRETSGIQIEHSGDGTLVHGTERGDKEATAALKANGFKWSSNLGAWYLPRNWSESTRAAKVQAVQAALGDRVAVDRGSVAKSTTAAERAAERTRRDAELAAAHTAQAGKLGAEADRRFGAAKAIGDHIPFGQPILVGHHSEGRHRRDLARIDSNMRAGVAAHKASEGASHRASEAAARVRLATNPQALSRRIDRNSAELRRLDRILNGTGKEIHGQDKPHPPGEHRDRLEAMRAELADSIEHDRQTVAAAGAPQHSSATVNAGDYVRIRGSLLRVEKSNPKTVTVKSHGLTLKYPYSEIQAHSTTEGLLSRSSDAQLQAFIYSKRGTPEAAVAQRILDERKRQASG